MTTGDMHQCPPLATPLTETSVVQNSVCWDNARITTSPRARWPFYPRRRPAVASSTGLSSFRHWSVRSQPQPPSVAASAEPSHVLASGTHALIACSHKSCRLMDRVKMRTVKRLYSGEVKPDVTWRKNSTQPARQGIIYTPIWDGTPLYWR